RAHELALRPPLDEAEEGDDGLGYELVGDLGPVAGGLEAVLAIELAHDVALFEHPAHRARLVAVLVGEGVVGAATHRRGAIADPDPAAFVVAVEDLDLFDI